MPSLNQRVRALEQRMHRLETRPAELSQRGQAQRAEGQRLRSLKVRHPCPSCHLSRSPRAPSCAWCGFVFAAQPAVRGARRRSRKGSE